MKYIIREKDNKITILNKYPNIDTTKPISEFDYTNNEIFEVDEEAKPNYDPVTEKINYNYSYTQDVGISPNTKIVRKVWSKEDLPDDQKQNNFENKFGEWMDDNYPLWKRQKHSDELNMNPTNERKLYIDEWKNWEFDQRNLLKEKINNKDYTFTFINKT